MKSIIYLTAFFWDNYQGGTGKFVDLKLLVDINEDLKFNDFWEEVHKEVKKYLKIKRPFDQTVYSKDEKEYVITKAEIL